MYRSSIVCVLGLSLFGAASQAGVLYSAGFENPPFTAGVLDGQDS